MKEHIARTIKEFYNKNQEYADIRNGLVAAIAIDVEEPMFESQTKTKLGSNNMWPAAPQEHKPAGPTVNKYVGDFIKTEVDNYLHKNPLVAEVMLQRYKTPRKSAKPLPASPSWHANAPRKPTCTTASCATAATT